jgi:hypothetical protein
MPDATTTDCGLEHGAALDEAYRKFQEQIVGRPGPFEYSTDGKFEPKEGLGKPFWTSPVTNEPDWTTSIASFLCTHSAWKIYDDASTRFDDLVAQQEGQPHIEAAGKFLSDTIRLGHRGTPH